MALIPRRTSFPGDEVYDVGRQHLEPEELERLWAVLDRDLYWAAYFRTQYWYGRRLSEVAVIQKAEVEWAAGKIVLRCLKKRAGPRAPAGYVERVYPVPAQLLRRLAQVRDWSPPACPWLFAGLAGRAPEGEPVPHERTAALRRQDDGWRAVSRSTAQRRFAEAAREAGLPDGVQTSHKLRHTRATLLLASGATVAEVCWLLGHASEKTTARYLHTARAMRDRVDQAVLARLAVDAAD